MNTEEADGVTVEDVIDAVEDADPEVVRDALEPVTDGAVVTRAAAESTVSDTAKLLATAETRIELAGDAYEDAVAAAEPVANVPTVRARLDGFAERLSAVESRIPELRPDLSVPADVATRPRAAYEFGVEIRDLVVTAQEAIEAADDLSFDAEQFESWVRRPDRRHDEFAEDVDLIAESAADLDAAAAAVPDAGDPAAQWAGATMRARVLSLLCTDLRAELDDLRTMADLTGDAVPAELEADLDAAERRVAAVEARLADAATPERRDRFGEAVASFEAALESFEPPIEWEAVDAALSDHRPEAVAVDAA